VDCEANIADGHRKSAEVGDLDAAHFLTDFSGMGDRVSDLRNYLKLHTALIQSTTRIDNAEDSAKDGATDGEYIFDKGRYHT